jgi:hypothetical protein
MLMLGIAMLLSVPTYIVVQLLLAVVWRGRWRIVALAPLIIALPALVIAICATVGGSNLGPLAFILMAPLGLVYLLIALAVRGVTTLAAARAAG